VFPLAHLYVAREVLSHLDEEIALGSIFPDTVIAMPIDWDATHRGFAGFFQSLKKDERSSISGFLAGFIMHGVEPRGLDYFGDEKYGGKNSGYSFQKSAPLVSAVSACLGVDEEMARWKAHNFIEMGVEMHLSRIAPDLGEILGSGLKNKKYIRLASSLLSRFYGIEAEEIEGGFGRFCDFVEPCHADSESLAGKYLLQLRHKHGLQGLDRRRIAALISEGEALIKDDLSSFLNEIIPDMRKEVRLWLGKYL
jgi:hypothetical protein